MQLLRVALVASLAATALIHAQSQTGVARCPGAPNQCSLHGSCVINRIGEHVCNCQWGYHGSDCAKKMCPHGVDPTSPITDSKKIRLVISAPALSDLTSAAAAQWSLRGNFILTFHAHSVELETPLYEITSEGCTRVFKRFQNLAEISCEQLQFKAPAAAVYEITLHSYPVYPVMNNLYRHDGNPRAGDFWCDASGVQLVKNGGGSLGSGGIQCSFDVVNDQNIKPYDPCSRHGLCNDNTGLCTCEDGYYGDNCANNKDEEDILVAPSTGPFFQGNVLRVSAKRAKSTDFNLIKADIEGATVFSMDGAGDTVFHDGSVYVKDGDLVVQEGQLRVHKGGSVLLEGAELKVQNSRVHVVHNGASDAIDTSTEPTPLLHLEATGTSSPVVDFMRVVSQNAVLFRLSPVGTVVVNEGGVEVLKGGVKVHRGGLQVLSDGAVIMQGGVDVKTDGMQVRQGDVAVQDGGVSVLSSAKTKPALVVESKSPEADTVVKVTGVSPISPLISASISTHATPAFEVLGSGETRIHSGGLKVVSGGVEVLAGGQVIHSGGLRVKSGGVVVESGTLTTRDGFSIEDGGLTVQNNYINGPVLALSSSNPHYAGSLIELTVNQTGAVAHRLIDAVNEVDGHPESVFTVESNGDLRTRGDITTLSNGRIIAGGALVSQAQVVFSNKMLLAGDTIEIPSSHSYVKITNDGVTAANRVVLDSHHAYAGQLLVIQNEDEQPLDGDVSVKPSAAAIFVFDGQDWRALTAASFDTSVISGVKSFEAANDLNFGEIKLTVNNLQVASQRAGYVAVYGKGGELTQDEQLQFDTNTGTLSVEKLEAHTIKGRIDMTQSELRGVEIVGGHISNVNMTDIAMVEVSGELFVEDQAFFGAGITVDGQVMGSGAYIDASDARFKKDVKKIDSHDALERVAQLDGVEYAYRTESYPSRHFSERRELGFLAQDVERVLPQVVAEDGRGFKYVAYGRVVPVLVEAMKQLKDENRRLLDTLTRLEARMQQLEQRAADIAAPVQ